MGAGSAPCQLTQRQGAQIPMQTPKRSFKTVAKPYAVRCAYWSKVRYLLFKGKRVGKTTNCVKYEFGAKNGEMLDYNQVKARRAKQLRCPQSGPPVPPPSCRAVQLLPSCSAFGLEPVVPLVPTVPKAERTTPPGVVRSYSVMMKGVPWVAPITHDAPLTHTVHI